MSGTFTIKTNREQVAVRTLFVDTHIGLKLFINYVLYIFIVCVCEEG